MLYHYYFGFYAMIPVIILGFIVQIRLNSTYSKYNTVSNSKGITGAQMAYMILQNAGIQDVRIVPIGGNLTDHYDPAKKTVRLSEAIYNGTSVAAVGIAAHECGHAIQHNVGYFPIKVRSAVVGLTNFSSKLLYILMIASIFLNSYSYGPVIFNIAILCYAVLLFFQLITLPVEFNASVRAVRQIEASGFSNQDLSGVRKVLKAAAMTYVAAALTALWQLLLMISRSNRNRR